MTSRPIRIPHPALTRRRIVAGRYAYPAITMAIITIAVATTTTIVITATPVIA